MLPLDLCNRRDLTSWQWDGGLRRQVSPVEVLFCFWGHATLQFVIYHHRIPWCSQGTFYSILLSLASLCPKESQMLRGKNKSSKTTIIKLFANHSSKKIRKKKENQAVCGGKANVKEEWGVQVEIIKKKWIPTWHYHCKTRNPMGWGI